MKKITLSIAAALAIAGATASFAAERPAYEKSGLPISAVQLRVLGAADIREQSPAASSTLTPVQLGVLTPRTKIKTATAAPRGTAGLSTR